MRNARHVDVRRTRHQSEENPMPSPNRSNRVVIVGGGLAGLSTAMRLAQMGRPVTLFERKQLGARASTRNQGWLRSGADIALDHPALSRLCHEGLRATLAYCPECVEPGHDGMLYFLPGEAVERWKEAWTATGIPHETVLISEVLQRVPHLEPDQANHAFRLPDRSIRGDVLLRKMMDAALQSGVEVRLHTPVARLLRDHDEVLGVETHLGEEITASLVVLAANTGNSQLLAASFPSEKEMTLEAYSLVPLKTHLIATAAGPSSLPLCFPEREGFHHLPHAPGSVFGTNRWQKADSPDDIKVVPSELERLRDLAIEAFPGFGGLASETVAWTETTIQPLSMESMETGSPIAAWPVAIDHAQARRPLRGVISAFAGRATLWPVISDKVSKLAAQKIGPADVRVAPPPWETAIGTAEVSECLPRHIDLYHCQKCGRVGRRIPGLSVPTCCETAMVRAAQASVAE
jgi:glycine oxidase